MLYNLKIYIMLFFIYAFGGWILECTLGIIQKRKFINRGFLIGPYCPIYGVGVVIVSLLLSRFYNNIVLLFIFSTILCGLLEYITSYIMEKWFHARWWDYSKNKFNINGRVCIGTLIPFGIICVAIISYANPWLLNKLYNIPNNILNYITIILSILILLDVCISLKVILKFKNMNKKEKDNTEELSKKVKEAAEEFVQKLMVDKEKLVRKIKINKYVVLKDIRFTRKNKVELKQIRFVSNLKNSIKNIDEKIKKSKKDMSERLTNIKENQFKLRKDIKERFSKQSKLNKRLISAFPNLEQKDYKRKKK